MLEPFGLSADEEDVYLRLLTHPESISDSAEDEKALQELRERGLAIEEQEGHWSPMPPDIAVELLSRAREADLHRARRVAGVLMEMYRVDPLPSDDRVELIVGTEAIRARYEHLIASASQEWLAFDKAPYVHPARNLDLELETLRRGVCVQSVYERGALTGRLGDIDRLVAAGEHARVLPYLPFKLVIIDRRWALVPVHRGDEVNRAILVRSSPLLEALQATFEAHWRRSVPLRPGACAAGNGTSPVADDIDRNLLSLLAAGVTDQAIARHLGLGLRTVQRRVSALMRQLGAQTRFQAGLQAVRRGLL